MLGSLFEFLGLKLFGQAISVVSKSFDLFCNPLRKAVGYPKKRRSPVFTQQVPLVHPHTFFLVLRLLFDQSVIDRSSAMWEATVHGFRVLVAFCCGVLLCLCCACFLFFFLKFIWSCSSVICVDLCALFVMGAAKVKVACRHAKGWKPGGIPSMGLWMVFLAPF